MATPYQLGPNNTSIYIPNQGWFVPDNGDSTDAYGYPSGHGEYRASSTAAGRPYRNQEVLPFFGQAVNGKIYDQMPGSQYYESSPDESFLSSFMQGPGMVLGSALGANALFGGGLGGLSSLFGSGSGASLFPGEAVIGNAFNPYGGSLLNSIANGLSSIPSGLTQLLSGSGAASGAAAGTGSNGMSVLDVLAGDDAAFGQSMLGNGWSPYNPTISIPGVGDVYGSPSSILQNFNNLLPGAGTAANVARSIFGGNNSGGSLLGAGLGALLGSLGANQKPAGTTTSIQDIPDYLKPYQSMNLTSGLSNMSQASAGQALLPGAQNYLQKTINGDYLDPNQNPAFQPYVKDLMGQAGANYAGLYGKNPDNLNNSGFQEGYTRAITNAVLPLYNSAFQTAQGNQFNAASNAPQYAGNVANAALAPNLAFKNLYTGPQATSQPYFTNPMGGALSGGLAGYTFGNSIFGSKN